MLELRSLTFQNKQEVNSHGNYSKTETAKVYKFVSQNKFLTCTALNIQFMDGKAETKDLAVAKELAKIDGVQLVEE